MFEELEIEADIIKAHRNIITYEKQGKEKLPTNLTDDPIDDIINELEKRRAKLSDNCRTAQYSKKGVDQLMLQSEEAKKLLSSINEKFPHYQNRTKLAKSIKKLDYAIKVTLKKIQTIQGHIQLYAEVSRSTETPKKKKID